MTCTRSPTVMSAAVAVVPSDFAKIVAASVLNVCSPSLGFATTIVPSATDFTLPPNGLGLAGGVVGCENPGEVASARVRATTADRMRVFINGELSESV